MRAPRPHRKGTLYLPVLSAATIVASIGLTAVCLTRTQGRAAQGELDYLEAQLYAQAAIEEGLLRISTYSDWRTRYGGGTWATDRPIGGGTYSLTVADPADGDLANSPEDSVVLTGTGRKGRARHKAQVTLVAAPEPLAALRTSLHSAGELKINAGKKLTAVGGPASTNANLRVDGVLDGNAECITRSGGGVVTGTTVMPAATKPMPDPNVFQTYRNLAVTVPFPGGMMEKFVLSPGSNPWGLTSADGVYYMDTGGQDVTIRGARIWGTLVIKATGKKVVLDDALFMEPYRSDYPVLIVDGAVEMKIRSKEYPLLESTWTTNFNPPFTPYGGQSDTDLLDTYPNEVRGLLHVKGAWATKNSPWLSGAVICESIATCDDFPGVLYDESLWTSPPMGYRMPRMKVAAGSWTQTVE